MPIHKVFPASLSKYSETPVFTQDTVPEKLTSVHDTKRGVWGKLVVLEGALDYIVPGPPPARQRITPSTYGIIEPAVPHRVELIGPVCFKVEFYREDRGEAPQR
ncbi:MAG: DUF1971 domain-containing protein [Parvularculaceae bacterium]